ncbi:hypothetical protein L226DRAFT_615137 [Lentinus tigrinus ALCF2SS1-7]|uniref:uncharacterized protein n=1 Tax=Lentinus tigrinus ALCF2SS1-7 TaxID=1328758 RepID=UPI0011662277|nr:hypothetical protein L226DRAFT_615137 [Lentinus tigrinus ALCF2SS1-7]
MWKLRHQGGIRVEEAQRALCRGDLPGQVSTSQYVATTSKMSYLGGDTGYIHYRVTMKEVGKPVEDFENGAQLISVIRDCVRAPKSP